MITDRLHEDSLKLLSSYKDVQFDYLPEISRDELSNIIKEYDGLIVRSRTKVTREILERGKKLKVIVRAGSGLDNIDVDAAHELNIRVMNVPETVANAVAELTIGLIIMLSRKLYKAVESLKRGEWIKNQLVGYELRDKKMGIVGVGNVGRRVAELASAFNMKLLLNDIVEIEEEFIKKVNGEVVDLRSLLRESDYVSLHIPLNKSTKRMIGEAELKLMKKTAFLINTARAEIVDPEVLYRALIEKWIAGAALDVYEVEPPTDLKLLKLENVICTPHIGAQTEESGRRASIEAIKLASRYLLEEVYQSKVRVE
ncbi:MAG: hydroxyacid dehydrogenase [Nitrososphaeria archaeon]|nr:hydroxyacid dehydrogenase [Nitrososphaeria archaeon]